jgi:predicted transcriptional regulator
LMEVISTYLEAVNKVKVAEENKLPRATMYKALKGKNPTIKTLAKLVNCCAC